eukprot:scaffold7683_cov1021-Pinguiococcus_pyrenoidosus.AAC.1
MVRMMTALSARELDAVARFYEVPALSSGRSKSDVLEEVTAVVRDSLEEVDMVGGLPLWNVFCTRRGRELYGQTKAALIREATRLDQSAVKTIKRASRPLKAGLLEVWETRWAFHIEQEGKKWRK